MNAAVFQLQAMSLNVPLVAGHPNRLGFNGTLTRVGIPSDAPPGGSNGKRVLITAEAAERAIPSLMGMGVNISPSADQHSKDKIGVITGAEVKGDELLVSGFIYSSDSPESALRILRDQAKLGFSFEARNISVESADDDPLIITDLFFTGASILIAQRAAYKTTRISALAAMQNESEIEMTTEEMKAALQDVVSGALAPVSAQLTNLAASHAALETRVEGFGKTFEVQAAMVAKVDPIASKMEADATAMEAAGVGTQPDVGHVAVMRRMAAAMRQDAAAGRIPQNYQHAPTPGPVQVALPIAAPRFEDSDAYKTMQASMAAMTTQLAAAADKQASTETRLADMKAAADLAKPAPDRKTLPPLIANLVAKTGLEMPEEGTMMSHGKLNQVLATSGLSTDQRMTLKTGLAKAGFISLNAAQ